MKLEMQIILDEPKRVRYACIPNADYEAFAFFDEKSLVEELKQRYHTKYPINFKEITEDRAKQGSMLKYTSLAEHVNVTNSGKKVIYLGHLPNRDLRRL